MRVLFWVGYRFEDWNSQSDGLGGTEIAVSKVAESLAQYGHEVTVAGEVISGVHNRVTWLSLSDFTNQSFKKDPNRFDIVVGVNYLHFVQLLDDEGLKPKQEPRPVVKQIMFAPDATCHVTETGS